MRISWAEWRGPIYGRTSNGFHHPAIGMVCHIMGSSTQSADNWFHSPKSGDPKVGAGATFGICNGGSAHVNSSWVDGHLIQWADTDDRCWAQGAGNPYYHSVETEGASGPMTDKQIETFSKLYKELHDVEGFPFALAEIPGQPGLGWHGMGGSAWGGHNYCPGPERRMQRGIILTKAQGSIITQPTQEEDMAGALAVVCQPGQHTPVPFSTGGIFAGYDVYISICVDYPEQAEIVIGKPGAWDTIITKDKKIPGGRGLVVKAKAGAEMVEVHHDQNKTGHPSGVSQPITVLVEYGPKG